MIRTDPEQRAEAISGLVERYRRGEFSEVVFTASLKAQGMRRDNISALVSQHRAAYVESLPYRRGDVT
jgi:hypothetical protein